MTEPAAHAHEAVSLRVAAVPCPSCDGAETSFERELEGYRLERCRRCDLVFVNPQPTLDELTALYLKKTPESQAAFYVSTVSPAQIVDYDRILADLRRSE